MSDNDRDSELGEESEYWRMLRDLRGGAGRSWPAEQQQPDRSTDWYGGQQPGHQPGQQQQPPPPAQHPGQQSGWPRQQTQDYGWPNEPEPPQRSWERTDLWQRQQPSPPPPYEPQPYQAQPDPYQQQYPQQQPQHPQRPAQPYESPGYDTQGYGSPQGYQPQPYEQPQAYENYGYEQRTYQPQYEQQPYEQQSYEARGYEQRPYEQQGYDPQTYDPQTYDPQTYDPQTYDPQTYDPQAYDSGPESASAEWSTQHWTDTPFESYSPPVPDYEQPGADEAETSQRYYEQPGGWDRTPDPASDRTEEHAFTAFQDAPPFQQDEGRPAPDQEPDPAARRGHRVGAEPTPTWWRRIINRLQLGPADLEVLGLWVVTRVSLLMISVTAPMLFSGPDGPVGWLDHWRQWDVLHFERIALEGYFGHDEPEEAFFPALPILMKLGNFVGISPALVGLLVSFVAGGIAAVALARLAGNEWGETIGRRAALVWMVAPPAVFLAAPYTESLFLGLAIPAWLAASKGNWRTAGILAGFACSVRISGMFLVIALAVYFVVSQFDEERRREWFDGFWLLLGGIPLAAYTAYLWVNTGDPLRWYHAQAENWNREFTWPHEALIGTLQAATRGFPDLPADQSANFEWMFRAELVAMLVGVVLTAFLVMLRRWGEATWVGIQVLAFSFSAWFFSVPRATLLWFPLWIAIAVLSVRHKWVWWSYALVAIPLFGVWSAAYLTGKWAG